MKDKDNPKKSNLSFWINGPNTKQKSSGKPVLERRAIEQKPTGSLRDLEKRVNLIPDAIFKDVLNPQQLNVLENLNGIHLINAGAGSGKTRTITYAILRLLKNNVTPRSIMLLTFTNKAAKEMRDGIENLIGMKIPGILHGTFHSTGNHFIKLFGDLLGDFTHSILDEDDAKKLLKDIINEFFEEIEEKKHAYKIINIKREREIYTPKEIKSISSLSVNCVKPLTQIVQERFSKNGFDIDLITKLIKRYKQKKRELSLYDFDDLLYYWLELLDIDRVQQYISMYKFILIDEFQDTNALQFKIIEKLKEINQNVSIIAVGDEDQSIYGFRGANYKNIKKFRVKFKECKIHPLTYNYRSTQEILDLANNSIVNNEMRLKKVLEQDPEKRKKGQKPLFTYNNDEFEQGEIITKRILKLLQNGCDLNKIAVLVRNSNCFDKIEYYLKKAKIPYELRGGSSFFEKSHIKLILSVLQIIISPKNVIAWIRVSKVIKGLGEKGILKIHNVLLKEENPLRILTDERKLLRLKKRFRLNENGLRNLSFFFQKITNIFDINDNKTLLYNSLKCLLEDSDILDAMERIYGGKPNYEARMEDLRQLPTYAEDLTNAQLEDFIYRLTLEQKEFWGDNKTQQKKIVISTIHQAKGLEWDIVFVTSLVEDNFPDFRSELPEQMEEERRIFYVAVTRAKCELCLFSYHLKRNEDDEWEVEISRFLNEINPNTYSKGRFPNFNTTL